MPRTPTASQSLEARITTLLSTMTMKEKALLCSGSGGWAMGACERLGVFPVRVTDGPHGIRLTKATAFPSGVSMAASWNRGLIHEVGQALAEETHAAGFDILLGPCVNIVRHPLAGRNFESFAEDPYLAGQIGVAFVRGVQSKGVGTSLKHFACNNQEHLRGKGDSVVDERTLREIYLPAFESVVKESDPWTVMCSYNRLNGEHASQNTRLLTDILRTEWGYTGVVISDWSAVHTTRAAFAAGLDVEMPGPARFYGQLLQEAVDTWQIPQDVFEAALRRILRLAHRAGKLGRTPPPVSKIDNVSTPAHQRLARTLAEEAITLLKNDNAVLPIDTRAVKSIAVIGPNADRWVSGGGSSYVQPPHAVTPLAALRERLKRGGPVVKYEFGCENTVQAAAISTEALFHGTKRKPGFQASYFNNSDLGGTPVVERIDATCNLWCWNNAPADGVTKERWSARFDGVYVASESGLQTLQLAVRGDARLFVDGVKRLDVRMASRPPHTDEVTGGVEIDFVKGRSYRLCIEYAKVPEDVAARLRLGVARSQRVGWKADIARAASLAGLCDVAVVFAGLPSNFETEGHDRPHMDLTGEQNDLIAAVAAANPRTVVVLNAGSPVTMPWIDDVAAVLLSYYPGMEGGPAVARALVGDVNPSGKLPVTFPKRIEDTPAYLHYPGGRQVLYGEGVFVGYRYYEMRKMEPLFPFGHGLSYTAFTYSNLRAPKHVKRGQTTRVTVDVKNAGHVAGSEVVQLYVADVKASVLRPVKELKAFAKVHLAPGQSTTVELLLDERSFSFYDPHVRKNWVAEDGAFELLVGSSSRDVRVRRTVELVA